MGSIIKKRRKKMRKHKHKKLRRAQRHKNKQSGAMFSGGFFTSSDRTTISRAAQLAEMLTQRYFDLADDEWRRYPYRIFTLGEVDKTLHQSDIFAHLVRYGRTTSWRGDQGQEESFGIVLQDPNILSALLRSAGHDLWTLGLFILTHELTHIVRFRRFDVELSPSVEERDKEEKLVHRITREILSGVTNTDNVLALYEPSGSHLREARFI
jgi:hypothetical protein